ncbi:MAG: type I DNA topoisomerase, partial [Spongiibacteraceae bacterium]
TPRPLIRAMIAEIDPKYSFLFEAPVKDNEGRDTVIRYSRKTKEQYVQSEVEGKPSGWAAFYEGGKWLVREKAKRAPAAKKPAKKAAKKTTKKS